MSKRRWHPRIFIGMGVLLAAGLLAARCTRSKKEMDHLWASPVAMHTYNVQVDAVGELEAAESTTISSQIRGDVGKIIEIIPDGSQVEMGDLLIKLDPTPFEERLKDLKGRIKEQTEQVASLEKIYDWEQQKAELEQQAVTLETDTARLEFDKIDLGDGPMEWGRLKKKMERAEVKVQDTEEFYQELLTLEKEGFLKPDEVALAKKKRREEQEAFEEAQAEYNHYIRHVYPTQKKAAQGKLERSKLREDEAARGAQHKVAEALVKYQAAKSVLEDLLWEEKHVQWELDHSEIRAPSPGMVVLRQDPRSSDRRKFRLGDVAYKNTPLLELPNLSEMTVKTRVREVDLCKVEVGKTATIWIDAYPNLQLKGEVTQIGVLAQNDGMRSGDKVFEVRIAIAEGDTRLRPGMTARVVIDCQRVFNRMAIPISAIFYDEDRSVYCYKQQGKRYVKQPLRTGHANDEWVEVRAGLKKGDVIALTRPKKGG